ncbi:MAG TPA: insulinase family protein [Candidatus Anaerotruncus excrementipullorum]|uniref:Insulinase family protein n=1 Tax=Candidatus Anaerotruncus excrementipullorum TaxID=2838465 RepID=A0A9D2B8R2_9FIRM|nr:insulinase family protein [Candidatus Anaerotruncus excrementipullorum]
MNSSFQREPIGSGVYFNSVTDPKFKHNRLTASLLLPLQRETVSENALLPFLLRKGCRKLPDFTQLNRQLCTLYGASLSGDVGRFGAYQALELSIYGVDDRFTLDQAQMVSDCAQLLADVLLDPHLPGGMFDPKEVELERQQLCDTIESLINDKRAYAVSRCREIMCEGEPLSIEKYGFLDKVKQITPQSATQTWHRVLETAHVELFFVGSGNPESAKTLFTQAFAKLQGRRPYAVEKQPLGAAAAKVREQVDELDVAQSKLVMGFRTGPLADDQAYAAMWLMTALFGGTPNSKLFLNVREKLSLCYYCAARFDRLTGLILVDSGVEKQNRPKAQEEILRQLEEIRAGNFTQEELTATLLQVQNSLRSVSDSLGGLESWYMGQIMNQTHHTPAQEGELLAQVTREELIQAAKQVQLDTVYFLTGKEAQ